MPRSVGHIIGGILGFGGYQYLRYIGMPLEARLSAVLAMAFAAVVGFPFGWFIAHLTARDSDVDTTSYRVIAWGNLLAWLLPVVGMMFSAMAWRFGKQSETSKNFYSWMCTVGGVLALGSAMYGGAHTAWSRMPAPVALQVERPMPGTGHSWPRCQFAAIERWPAEEAAFCNNHRPTAEEMQEFERLRKEYEAQAS